MDRAFRPVRAPARQPRASRWRCATTATSSDVYNPELGDGRGFLFAQLHDLRDGRLLDLGTKGSGRTPWSRGGDGRLTLKGGVREVLATAMLEALGVDTSKTFSLIETGEALVRGDEPSPTRSSVLVRLSHSHIRIGTFQRFAYLEDAASLRRLLDHAVATYMPETWREDEAARAAAFLERVGRRVARMGAQWMAAGFVHGVLNTDNINVTGESFDYGPWRFLPTYDPGLHRRLFRPDRPLRLRPPAGDAAVEPVPPRRVPPAAGAEHELEDAMDPFARLARGLAAVLRRLGLQPRGEPGRRAGRARFLHLPAQPRPRSSVLLRLARRGRERGRAAGAPPPNLRSEPSPFARRWPLASRRPMQPDHPTSPGPRPAPC